MNTEIELAMEQAVEQTVHGTSSEWNRQCMEEVDEQTVRPWNRQCMKQEVHVIGSETGSAWNRQWNRQCMEQAEG
jgi:hypothetical protein